MPSMHSRCEQSSWLPLLLRGPYSGHVEYFSASTNTPTHVPPCALHDWWDSSAGCSSISVMILAMHIAYMYIQNAKRWALTAHPWQGFVYFLVLQIIIQTRHLLSSIHWPRITELDTFSDATVWFRLDLNYASIMIERLHGQRWQERFGEKKNDCLLKWKMKKEKNPIPRAMQPRMMAAMAFWTKTHSPMHHGRVNRKWKIMKCNAFPLALEKCAAMCRA